MKKISQPKLEKLPAPNIGVADQDRIVAYLNQFQVKTSMLGKLQAKVSVELSVLLPSILDKAFKGEL